MKKMIPTLIFTAAAVTALGAQAASHASAPGTMASGPGKSASAPGKAASAHAANPTTKDTDKKQKKEGDKK